MGGQGEEDPLENAPNPFLFFLSGAVIGLILGAGADKGVYLWAW